MPLVNFKYQISNTKNTKLIHNLHYIEHSPVICGMRVEFLDIDEAAEDALVARVL